MNYLGKHERNMVIRGIELTGKRVAAVELPSRVHTTDQGCGVGSPVIRLRLRAISIIRLRPSALLVT